MTRIRLIALFAFFLFSVSNLFAQPWNDSVVPTGPDGNPTLFDFQKAFYSYWKDKTPGKGEGYSQFKRWEWFWEQRVGLSGVFPPADINQKEWEKFQASRKNYKVSPVSTYWTFMGPSTTPGFYNGLGRLNCIAFHPTDSNTMWVGSPGGGVWKTTDGGGSWTPLSDFNAVLGVSSIAVNPVHPDSLYIATGDGERGSLWGMTGGPSGDNKSIGVLLSTDGGSTWKPTGMNWNIYDAKLISKIIMDPSDTRHLLIASSDGVYETRDAGAVWVKRQAGYFMDIGFCPGKPSIVYATTYDYDGNSKVYRSNSGGSSFVSKFTVGHGSRITLGTTPQNPGKVHLLAAEKKTGKFGGIYESLDTGNTFKVKYDTGIVNILSSLHNGKNNRGQGWYDLAYLIHPKNENIIFVGGVNLWKSVNGADSFRINTMWVSGKTQNPNNIQVTHADKHFLAMNPLTGHIYDCNDGGVYITRDTGNSWKDLSNGLGIMQFYRMSISEQDTAWLVAGAQDNGSKVYKFNKWVESTGGDGMDNAVDPTDKNVFYTGIQYGKFSRTFYDTVKVISDNIPGKPRGSWVTPFVIDPNDNKTLYAGYKAIYKSTDQGNTWVPICDSLWRPNFVINIAVAPTNSKIIYASDYYRIYKTINGGTTWTLVTSTGIPITQIKVHPRNPDIIYYSVSSYVASGKVYRVNSIASGVEKVNNLTLNLPNVAVNCIIYDKDSREGLFIGTDIGTFYKDTAMGAWEPLNANMPNVVVTDLEINYRERILYASTFGRGVWKTHIPIDPSKIAPLITTLEPPDNAVKIHPNSQLIAYFNEPVKKGTGIISIFEGGVEKQRIQVQSDSVKVEGNRIVVTPAPMGLGKAVYIRFPAGTFTDHLNNPHKGINLNTEWNFTITTDASVRKVGPGSGLTIHPNPGKGVLHIHCEKEDLPESIRVFNPLGACVLTLNPVTAGEFDLDLTGHAAGVYHVLTLHGNETRHYRVLLE